MRLLIPTITLFATITVALPEGEGWYLRRGEEIEAANATPLQVTLDQLPGKVFTGSAESIVAEINKFDPSILANVTSSEDVVVEERGLDKREGEINCNWGQQPVSQWNNCLEGMTYLMQLGQANARCGVSGGGGVCARVSCSHNCGIYLCNRWASPMSVYCGNIPGDVNAIANKCISPALGRIKGARDFANHYIGLASPQPGGTC